MSVQTGLQGTGVHGSLVGAGHPVVVSNASGVAIGAATESLDYRRLFDAVPTPCAILTVEAVLLEVNSAFERAVGQTRSQLVGRRLTEGFPGNPSESGADASTVV